jgi:hypothetical protein
VILLLFGRSRAGAHQPGFAANRSVTVNNSAFGRLVDGRDQRGNVAGLSVSVSGALAQSANSTQNLMITQSATMGLASTFGSGFGISHEKNSGRERHGCAPVCQPWLPVENALK